MNATHTPTPWTIDRDYVVHDNDGEFVAFLATAANRNQCDTHANDPEGEANAAFIVRACNSHDALVAALRFIVTAIDGDGVRGGTPYDRHAIHSVALTRYDVDAIRAALAAAGETP